MSIIKKTSIEIPYPPFEELSRRVAAEGSVMIKNDNNVLPISKDERIAIFGRTQIDYYKSGFGSGGLVNVKRVYNILDGIDECEDLTYDTTLANKYREWCASNPFPQDESWGEYKYNRPEMKITEGDVTDARTRSDVAVFVIGRYAGEARDFKTAKGSYYLSKDEEDILKLITTHYDKVVVLLNVGGVIDMNWVDKYNPSSVVYIWHGGHMGGLAVADILSGKVSPAGHLTDTIPKSIEAHPATKNFGHKDKSIYEEDIYVGYRYFETFAPEDVAYPFGFGLTYTKFEMSLEGVKQKGDIVSITIKATNIGDFSSYAVAQIYYSAPQGRLGKPTIELGAFKRTKLLAPGKSEKFTIEMNICDWASYDDCGATGHRSCYVLESGEYTIYLGSDVKHVQKVSAFNIDKTRVVEQLTEQMAPIVDFEIMHPVKENEKFVNKPVKVHKRTTDYYEQINNELPPELPYTGDVGIKLEDVRKGKASIEEFLAQLTNEELAVMMRGEGMSSPKVRQGTAGAIGGLSKELNYYGIPAVACTDGPSGVRLDNKDKATSFPVGTLIACTWDTYIAEELYSMLSIELSALHSDSILGPGINIHRSPLNGRNFEYFSEDPYLTGKFAAAECRGAASDGNSATIKHFAVNSQEANRTANDSILSERALREIYLKPFEWAVREGKATSLMTSYNMVNGRYSSVNYELNTKILRDEWNYEGFVMTDWWTRLSTKPEDESTILHELVAAQNDVYMVCMSSKDYLDDIPSSLENGSLTRGQLARNAENVVRYIMNSNSYKRFKDNDYKIPNTLYSRLESLKPDIVIESPANKKEIPVCFNKTGAHILELEYYAKAPIHAQLYMVCYFGDKSVASLHLKGTEGKTVIGYCEVFAETKDVIFKTDHDDRVIITKATFLCD